MPISNADLEGLFTKAEFQVSAPAGTPTPEVPEIVPPAVPEFSLFYKTLLNSMRDGVIFVDRQGTIENWSQAVEIMTGISSSNVVGRHFAPKLLSLADCNGNLVSEQQCPLQDCLRTGKKRSDAYRILGRSGRESKVDITYVPVKKSEGDIQGAIVLVHDASAQLDLKRQLKDLYEFSMLDPLTQVANRAEFERTLDQYLRANQTSDFKCSLIICDIDFFKSINDNYNHHIGDQALIAFASLLKKFVRAQDIVARYGGEEFVILCGDCDGESAVQRAEEIRVTLTKTPQQMLNGKCITASFGVSELSKTDTATTFFVRADSALLQAKEMGRNRVIAASSSNLGAPCEMNVSQPSPLSGVSWRNFKGQSLVCEEFVTSTPMSVLVEKLRGYILESEAELRRVEADFATVLVQAEDEHNHARKGNFVVDIEFQERQNDREKGSLIGNRTSTYIRISIREGKRKWFATNHNELAAVVLRDIRRYLMINEESAHLKVDAAVTKSTRL